MEDGQPMPSQKFVKYGVGTKLWLNYTAHVFNTLAKFLLYFVLKKMQLKFTLHLETKEIFKHCKDFHLIPYWQSIYTL
jgi:hypothetical protein